MICRVSGLRMCRDLQSLCIYQKLLIAEYFCKKKLYNKDCYIYIHVWHVFSLCIVHMYADGNNSFIEFICLESKRLQKSVDIHNSIPTDDNSCFIPFYLYSYVQGLDGSFYFPVLNFKYMYLDICSQEQPTCTTYCSKSSFIPWILKCIHCT